LLLLPLPPEYWDYRHVPPCLACLFDFKCGLFSSLNYHS
jgi:hypothetical protein